MVRPVDLIGKTLIDSFICTNIFDDRSTTLDVNILGRAYKMTGESCPYTIVGNIYAYGPNVEPDNYLLLIGVSDSDKIEVAVEAAAMNANLDPIYMFKTDKPISNEIFNLIAKNIYDAQRVKLIATDEEKEKYNADIIAI